MSLVQLSPQNGTEKNSVIENNDLSKKIHETGKSPGLRNTEDI